MVVGKANRFKAFKSLASIHNETCTMHTHLIDGLLVSFNASSFSNSVIATKGPCCVTIFLGCSENVFRGCVPARSLLHAQTRYGDSRETKERHTATWQVDMRESTDNVIRGPLRNKTKRQLGECEAPKQPFSM